LTEADRNALQELVQDGRIQQRIARRARVLLAMEDATTVVQELTQQVAMSRSGIWRLCRRYEGEGIAVLEGALQSGRPRHFSPLGAGADRATGLL
jgi:transposase